MYKTEIYGDRHSNDLVIIQPGIEFLQRWEKFRAKPYPDGKREDESIVWSAMYGHAEDGDNGPFKMTPDMNFTKTYGMRVLLADMNSKANYVRARVKVPITSYMFNAFISLAFQYGNGRVDKSGLWDILNGENYVDAGLFILTLNTYRDGTFSRGLQSRRACEHALYTTFAGEL